jgi:hypothetical protein
MTQPSQQQRKPRAIAIIEKLDDGSIRVLPIAGSEDEITDITRLLEDRIKLDE